MAKNRLIYLYGFLLYCCCLGCVSKAGVTDTDTEPGKEQGFVSVIPPVQDSSVRDSVVTKVSSTVTKVAADTVINHKIVPVVKEKVVTVVSVTPVTIDPVAAVKKVYSSQVGVREATGHNDGKVVEMYLASVGLSKGNPWCAAFVHYCLLKAGVKNPITGYSPTTFNENRKVWFKAKFVTEPRTGDVFSLYFPSLNRIAHTGFFDHKINSSVYETVEGNTNDNGSREGDGVYRKKRSFNSTYALSRWIP